MAYKTTLTTIIKNRINSTGFSVIRYDITLGFITEKGYLFSDVRLYDTSNKISNIMKSFLTILAIFFSAVVFAQTNLQEPSVIFCTYKCKVPEGSTTTSENKIRGNNYSMDWNYVSEEKLKGIENEYIAMASMLGKFKKKRITCYLLDKQVEGYKVSYQDLTGTTHQIYASGVVDGKAVSLLLSLNNEPYTNSDLPEFSQQILRLTK